MPTILVATDFSDCAADAAGLATDIARRYSAGIELVHVSKMGDHTNDPQIEAQLGQMRAQLTASGLDFVRTRQLVGTPDEAIVAHAGHIDANLIAMGTNGRRGLAHALIGSTAEKVVRHAPCPVLTVRADHAAKTPSAVHATKLRSITKILVPTDFSTHAAGALRQAADLARHYDAHVTLMHIYLRATYIPPGTTAQIHTKPLAEAIAEFQRALDELRATAENLGAKHVTAAPTQGVAETDIVRFARERHFDLIVMGTHGRTGLRRAVMGSIAEHVVRDAPCPVITVHENGPMG